MYVFFQDVVYTPNQGPVWAVVFPIAKIFKSENEMVDMRMGPLQLPP